MATAQPTTSPIPKSAVDLATGRLLPQTEEERKARSAALAQVLANMPEADETDSDEIWAEVFRGIDEGRPHRPLFEGMY